MQKTTASVVTTPINDIALRTRWSVRLHWYMLTALSLSGLFAILIAEGFSPRFFSNIVLLGIFILSNFIFYFLARGRHSQAFYRGIVLGIIIYEILFITLAMYLNGGLESQIFILYMVPILMAAITLPRSWMYLSSVFIAAVISLFLWADYQGWITSADKITFITKDYQYVVNTIVFIGLMVLLITYLASYIVNLLQQRERQALANAEALARAQAIARLGSWELNIADNTVTGSEQMQKLFGLRNGNSTTLQAYVDKIHPDDQPNIEKAVSHSLKTGRPYKTSFRVLAGGKIRVIRSEGRVEKSAAGRPVKLIGTAQDITAEQALEQAKNDFVSIASHQLRTPATEVKMLLALLKDGYVGKLTPKQHQLVNTAFLTNERQIKIANDLLGIARLDAGRIKLVKQPIELGTWLDGISKNFQPLFKEKDQRLLFKPLKKPLIIRADAERLQLAIENLLDNASKYTPAGGTVKMRYSLSSTQAVISVQDTGIGIAKSDQQAIFNIYTRLDNQLSSQVNGSGLGLYLVKKLVDLHHGKVGITSRHKAGTTFRIYLPL